MKKELMHEVWQIDDFRSLLCGIEDKYGEAPAFLWRDSTAEDGVAVRSYQTFVTDVRALCSFLAARGYTGKNITVTGKNSYGWVVSYFAGAIIGNMVVPMDKELRPDQYQTLTEDSESAAILYTPEMEEKLTGCKADLLPLTALGDYCTEGQLLRDTGDRAFENAVIDPDAPSVLLYTSGTMGVAKGVMLSQNNICSDIMCVRKKIYVGEKDRVLSHLPLHHTYECMTELAGLYSGASIAYNDGMRRLPGDLQLFRPTILITVPAVLEFLTKFIRKGYKEARGGGVLMAAQKLASGSAGLTVGLFSEDAAMKQKRKIFSTVDHFFGGELHTFLVGAAPLAPEIIHLVEQCGYKVYCGYGLTETSPIVIEQGDDYRSAEDSGKPVPGVEIRIDDPDGTGVGELCIRGPMVMKGYYKKPEATAEAIDEDGWFHSGDLAMKTKTGAYAITGRMKSMIVSPTGKKIFPEELEAYLMKDDAIGECLVYAEDKNGKQQLVASVYPDESVLTSAIGVTADDETYEEKERKYFSDLISRTNASFPVYKHISRLVIRRKPFVKTTTRKIRRNDAENKTEE
ncbi:MAG: AMP-binding protein [Clostridia bacterium]|nr:AMP-binding protein [Clostridia bacterium]